MDEDSIVNNRRANGFILRCLDRLRPSDSRSFRRKFVRTARDAKQQHHVLHELVVGAYLRSCGLDSRSEVGVLGLTPDWSLFQAETTLLAIVEVVTFELDVRTDGHVGDQLRIGPTAGYFAQDAYPRLYNTLDSKASKYRSVAASEGVPYVIALVPTFKVDLSREELDRCLYEGLRPIFSTYPDVSGVLVVTELAGIYTIQFERNPHSTRAWHIASGQFAG